MKDELDHDKLEQQAYLLSGFTEDEFNQLTNYASTLDDKENIIYQQDLLEMSNKLFEKRIELLRNYYAEYNLNFAKKNGIDSIDIVEISELIPTLYRVNLTKNQILKLEKNDKIMHLEFVRDNDGIDFANNARTIIGGNTFINAGYTGSSIRVGLIESGHPRTNTMGSEGNNIEKTNTASDTDHATMTCGIIKRMASGCSIYTRAATSLATAVSNAEWLIKNRNVRVINISYGSSGNGNYTANSRNIDRLINNTKTTFCIASGNLSGSQVLNSTFINELGISPNAITVGAVTRSGTNPAASNAYSLTNYSLYRENSSVVNKPDICAPGNVSIYSYSKTGTSFATPLVTGSVVQMMARNSGLLDKPQTLKAAIKASASYNAGSSMNYVQGSRGSDREGAGVIDADFCYRVARNGRRTHFDATSGGTTSWTCNAYADYTSKPLRIAVAWEVANNVSTTSGNNNFNISIYKSGTLIGSSTASSHSTTNVCTNYEVYTIPTSTLQKYGAGYYEVRISRTGSFTGPSTNRIGIAWEQRS